MKMRIGIVFGGRSGEHEVSIRSAATVIRQIDHNRYFPIPIAIDQYGIWHSPAESLRYFPDDVRQLIGDQVAALPVGDASLSGDTSTKGLSVKAEDSIETIALDVIFPVLHGTYGEDGTIQGLFEMADLPYIGCGVLASSCGMDKTVMKSLFKAAGLPICRHTSFLRGEWEADPAGVVVKVEKELGYPCFVKPANLGSSVGVSRADDADSLEKAIAVAAEFDRKIIVEEALDMREIECAVLGNDDPAASLPGEYIIRDKSKKFLDYTEKYAGTGNNEFVVPAPVSDALAEKIREMALRAFKSIDGSGLARVDFFLRTDNGSLLVNEINTMPGLTDASGYPKMWEGSGKTFSAVIDDLVELAFERHRDKGRTKTAFRG